MEGLTLQTVVGWNLVYPIEQDEAHIRGQVWLLLIKWPMPRILPFSELPFFNKHLLKDIIHKSVLREVAWLHVLVYFFIKIGLVLWTYQFLLVWHRLLLLILVDHITVDSFVHIWLFIFLRCTFLLLIHQTLKETVIDQICFVFNFYKIVCL